MVASKSISSERSVSERNLILESLDEDERSRILPKLERITLTLRLSQYEQGERIKYCYFPLAGVISLTQSMKNGHAAEVGVFGREGMVGIPVYFGQNVSDHNAFVQLPGSALRIKADEFARSLEDSPSLARLMRRYANAQLSIASTMAACNALHTAEERLARWLLSVRDRADSDSLLLTHEFLALMLGTRRATVTITAGALERAGLIELGRGAIRILNREGLHEASCECYDRAASLSERVFLA